MKRRSFLSLLGLAPAAPLIAREMAKSPAPVDERVRLIKKALADSFPKVTSVWAVQPLDEAQLPWEDVTPQEAVCREMKTEGNARHIELTITFPCKKGIPLPRYSRVFFMGKPALTMPTDIWGETDDGTITIVQNIMIH